MVCRAVLVLESRQDGISTLTCFSQNREEKRNLLLINLQNKHQNWFRLDLTSNSSNIKSKKAAIPGIFAEKINAEAGKKSIFFDENSKCQNACPPLPVDRMS